MEGPGGDDPSRLDDSQELRTGIVTGSLITENGVRRQLTLAQPGFRQSTQATDAVARIMRTQVERLRYAEGCFTWVAAPVRSVRVCARRSPTNFTEPIGARRVRLGSSPYQVGMEDIRQ